MVPTPDFSAHVKEARIAIEAAIAVADLVAHTEITQSSSFNQMVVYMHDAVEALAKTEAEPNPEGHILFPSEESANNHLAKIKPCGSVAYRLARSADGRWTVQVFRFAGTL
jgi:hypothetical protein